MQVQQFLSVLPFHHFLGLSSSPHIHCHRPCLDHSIIPWTVATLSQIGFLLHSLPLPTLPQLTFHSAANELSEIFIYSFHKYLCNTSYELGIGSDIDWLSIYGPCLQGARVLNGQLQTVSRVLKKKCGKGDSTTRVMV